MRQDRRGGARSSAVGLGSAPATLIPVGVWGGSMGFMVSGLGLGLGLGSIPAPLIPGGNPWGWTVVGTDTPINVVVAMHETAIPPGWPHVHIENFMKENPCFVCA